MSHALKVTDEQFRTLELAARKQGKVPDALLADWIEELRDRDTEPHYFETDDWFRHLGVSEERIARIKAEVEEEEACRDADAR